MEKTATLNLRINPTVKKRAEDVLTRLGIPMSTAIDIYLNQISLTGGIWDKVEGLKKYTVLRRALLWEKKFREKKGSWGFQESGEM